MAADSGGLYEPLHLEPFIHQVGGHSSMLQLDDSTICKPLIPQELNFYGSSPDSLKPFMPEFRGVIEVNFSEGSDGYLVLTAYLPETYKFSCSKFGSHSSQYQKNGESKKKHRIRLCQSGNIQIESSSEDVEQLFEEGNHGKGHNGSPLNPWVIHCHQEQLNKIRKSSSATMLIHKYILLENLTSNYEFPCVLDLKMGTRQYGDDASLAKRQSHMAKVASTTSSTLGVRICGMQVYHIDSGHFICHNKYYGRSLTVEGFQQALYRFLHNGNKLRHDVITPLLEKLHHLYAVVQHLDTFRFFTSSLLIIYDGKECSTPAVYNGNNFHTSSKCKDGVTLQLSDNGNMNKQTTSGTGGAANSNFVTGHKDDLANVYQAQMFPKQSQQKTDGKDMRIPAPLIDVRMIDFAHSTQSQMKGIQNVHKGPDEGYLFGLKNLIAQLKIIQQESG